MSMMETVELEVWYHLQNSKETRGIFTNIRSVVIPAPKCYKILRPLVSILFGSVINKQIKSYG